jgi:hypothetical protein
LEAALEASHRLQGVVNRHRQATGYVREEELVPAFGAARARTVYAAVRQLAAQEQRPHLS